MSKKYIIFGVCLGAFLSAFTPNTIYGLIFALCLGTIGGLVVFLAEKKHSK